MKNYLNTIKSIRENNQHIRFKDRLIMSWLISARLSPLCSAFFVEKKIRPNQITLLMILSGLIGAILFALPNLYFKIAGAIFIQLWFAFDCSDGEVARFTKHFSKFGSELDFVAHVINHPFFIVSFCLNFIQLYDIVDIYKHILLFSVFIISEFWSRSSLEYDKIIKIKSKKISNISGRKSHVMNPRIKKLILYIYFNLWGYPNYILVFPFLFCMDSILGTYVFFHLTLAYAIYSSLINSLTILRKLFIFYYNE